MAMKEQQRSVYRTMQGREIDMHKLAMQNEMTVAIGNARVNARGDELGPGGRIIRKREDILREAQGSIPDQVRVQAEAPVADPIFQSTETKEVSTTGPIITASRYSSKKVSDMDPEGDE